MATGLAAIGFEADSSNLDFSFSAARCFLSVAASSGYTFPKHWEHIPLVSGRL